MDKNLYKSYGYKTIEILIVLLYAILLIPILLNYWSMEVYGSWIAILAIFNFLQVFEQGHATFVGNKFNRIVNSKPERGKEILGSAIKINFIICLIEILVLYVLYITGSLRYFLDDTINDKTVVLILFIMMLYRLFFGSYRGIIVKTLNPFGLIYKSYQFSLTEIILDFFILCIAAFSGLSLVELAVFWFMVKVVYSLIILYQLKRLLPEFFPWWKTGNFKMGIHNFRESLYFTFSNFLEKIGNDGVTLFVSAFLGTSFLPLFVATKTIVNFGSKVSDLILSPLSPIMINLYSKNQKSKILDIFRSYWFFTSVILIIGYLGSLYFIDDLFKIWTSGKLEFNLLLYSGLIFIYLIQNNGRVLNDFFLGLNKKKVIIIGSVLKAAVLIILYFFYKEVTLRALLRGLIIAEFVVAGIWFPISIFKIFNFTIWNKILFYLNIFAVFYVGIYLYLNGVYKNIGLLLFVLALPLPLLLYFQYSLIPKNTLAIILKKFNIKSKFFGSTKS